MHRTYEEKMRSGIPLFIVFTAYKSILRTAVMHEMLSKRDKVSVLQVAFGQMDSTRMVFYFGSRLSVHI